MPKVEDLPPEESPGDGRPAARPRRRELRWDGKLPFVLDVFAQVFVYGLLAVVGYALVGVVGVLAVLVLAACLTFLNVRGSVKTCPECAERVKQKARVCRHCGYRFAPARAG